MNTAARVPGKLDWLALSVGFCKNHFLIIFGLGLLAAFGRATQLGAFGKISDTFNILLEIGVELSRVLIFLFALGLTNVRTGVVRLVRMFSAAGIRQQQWRVGWQKLKSEWAAVVLNLVLYLFIAWAINYLIDYAAYQTCLYAKLQSNRIIAAAASEWSFILFLKNISIIPFTLVFNALFLLWLTNKVTNRLSHN